MKNVSKNFDIIVIGGGAIGSFIAWQSSLCGYKVLLVEKEDFASQTSSRSTKLLHGGVRYLENAFLHGNISQYTFVKESLIERKNMMHLNNTLCKKIEILTPIYSYFDLVYYYFGLKLYDVLSGKNSLGNSTFVSKKKLKSSSLRQKGLVGAISYFDGSFIDHKLLLSVIQNAHLNGCEIKNYCEVVSFIKEEKRVKGVRVFNPLMQSYENYEASCFINATGANVDRVRGLCNPLLPNRLTLSKGSHICVPKEFLPNEKGLLIPKTADKRVIFMLPWQDCAIIGTTDIQTSNTQCQKITNEEIEYLLAHVNDYLEIKIEKKDILSTFSGVRALLNNKEKNSASLSREHDFEQVHTNVINVLGGKWTTSMKIAKQCLSFAWKHQIVDKKKSIQGEDQKIIFNPVFHDIEHKFENILKNEEELKSFILYCIEKLYAKRVIDVIARRTSLALTQKALALNALPFVAQTMGDYLLWDETKIFQEMQFSKNYLEEYF